MGCLHSSLNRIRVQPTFDAKEISLLTKTWNFIKINDPMKFADQVLRKSMNENENFRQLWSSKSVIEGNNYDYSQGDSCLRSHSSRYLALKEQNTIFLSSFEQILSLIENENEIQMKIVQIPFFQTISIFDRETLNIFQKSMIEVIRNRCENFQCEQKNDLERIWNKFLTFLIENLLKNKSMKIIVSPATNVEQNSTKIRS